MTLYNRRRVLEFLLVSGAAGFIPAQAQALNLRKVLGRSPNEHFNRDVLAASANGPVVVLFGAAWCAPCKSFTTDLEEEFQAYEKNGWLYRHFDTEIEDLPKTYLNYEAIPYSIVVYKNTIIAEAIGDTDADLFLERADKVVTRINPRFHVEFAP